MDLFFSFLAMYSATAILGHLMFDVGGGIYTLLTLPAHLKYVSPFYRLITDWPLRLSFLFKFIGFVVSASGCLLPLFFVQAWFPAWLNSSAILWGAMLGALSVTLSIMHRAHLMQTTHIDHTLEALSKFSLLKRLYGFDLEQISKREKMQFARMYFADVMAVDLLRIGASFTVVQFTGSALGLFSASPSSVATPGNALMNVLALLRIISGTSWQLDGPFGLLVIGFYGISIFFFLSFFVSLASRMIDEPLTPVTSPNELISKVEAATENFVAQLAEQDKADREAKPEI